jgi:hypothetical protein
MNAILESLPAHGVGLAFLAIMIVAVEIGYRAGTHTMKRSGGKSPADVAAVQAAVLGILGLLLGFTYAFVASRVEARRQAVIEEANAIGTAYLRASLAPEPIRGQLQQLLRQYLDTRIISDDVANDPQRLKEAVATSEGLQTQIWQTASKLLENRTPTTIDSILFTSLNEVFDMHTRRIAAGRDRLPILVFIVLVFIGVVSVGVTGFISGSAGNHRGIVNTLLCLLLTIVLWLIVDLDRPRKGLLRASQQSLIELQQSLHSAPSTSSMGG